MKQIKANIAVSLDGFIATPDNELDWMPQNVRTLLNKEYETTNYLLLGANTYTCIFEHWGGWPYKSKKTFVVANTPINTIKEEYLSFITDNPFDVIQGLKKEMESDLVVIGGGKLITSLINTELLDELTIYTIPIMLGEGISFIGKTIGSTWKTVDSAMVDGAIRTSYQFADVAR